MATKELYRIAEKFRDAKVWDALGDTDLFAVRFDDGQIGYCSVMGGGGEHFALGLYLGDEGLSSLLAIPEGGGISGLEIMISQRCLMCSFEDEEELTQRDAAELQALGLRYEGSRAFPQFRKSVPMKMPWYITEEDELARLALALEAAVEMGGRVASEPMRSLGFSDTTVPMLTRAAEGFAHSVQKLPEAIKPEYPSPLIDGELMIARFKKMKPTRGQELICDVSPIPTPIDGEPPYFPMALVVLSKEDGIVALDMVEDYERDHHQLLRKILACIAENGKPECLYASNPRALHLLGNVAKQIGLRVALSQGPSEMDALKTDLFAYLQSSTAGGSPFEDDEPRAPAKDGNGKTGGVCYCCGKRFAKAGMLKHLNSCKERKIAEGDTEYFLLRVEGLHYPAYFLYLDVMADTKLSKLDDYLRDIWMECCGHGSAYLIKNEAYCSTIMEPDDKSMNYALRTIARVGSTFEYEYDFGATTYVRISVLKAFTAAKRRNKIALLARNLSPVFPCVACGKPATLVCGRHYGKVDENAYCETCAPTHECGDEAMLPIVNSPRCGVCAYGAE